MVATLKRLSETSDVSGYEDEVREIVREIPRPLADDMRTDALGNDIAMKVGRGTEPRPAPTLAIHINPIFSTLRRD